MNNHERTTEELFPNLKEGELAVAEDNRDRYLLLVLRIYERLEADGRLSEIAKKKES